MKYSWFESASPFVKLLLTLFLMLGCFLIVLVFAVIVAVPFAHMSANSILAAATDIQNSENINLLKYLQVVQSIALFIIPSFIVAYLFGSRPKDYLSFKIHPSFICGMIAICLIIVVIPLINYLNELNSRMQLPISFRSIENWMKTSENNADRLSELFLKVSTVKELIFNLFMMAILPALGEEFIFRGVFQRIFTEMFKNYHWGIFFSAALFSAIHLQFYGFIPRMLLGVVFGYMLVWSGTIWVPVIAHFMNNALGILYYYLNSKGMVDNTLDTIGTGKQEFQTSLISLLLSGALLYLFYSVCKRRNEKINYN